MAYHYIIKCPKEHVGIIIGVKGATINKLIRKWDGKIQDISVNTPSEGYVCIYGEQYAVHILALELNDMIKISMDRRIKELEELEELEKVIKPMTKCWCDDPINNCLLHTKYSYPVSNFLRYLKMPGHTS